MIIHDALTWMLVWMAGVTLGALFFGGLWWTVRTTVASKRPELWLLVSLLLRMTVALSGLYVVSGRHWERMLLCLLGFMMARPLVTWLTRPASDQLSVATHEASRAP